MVTISVFEFCHTFNFCNLVLIWDSEFCQNLNLWVLTQLDFLSFVIIWWKKNCGKKKLLIEKMFSKTFGENCFWGKKSLQVKSFCDEEKKTVLKRCLGKKKFLINKKKEEEKNWWKKEFGEATFQSIGPLGRCFWKVDLSICFSVCLCVHNWCTI